MRAMILAAGRGERMRPLTDSTPKPLLQVGDKPLIVWHIERLVAVGITHIMVNHAWLGTQIEHYLGNGSRFGAQISYSPEPVPLETAGGIAQALDFFQDEPFLVINGDVWCDWEPARLHTITAALAQHAALAWLLLVDNPEHNPSGDFALALPQDAHTHDRFNTINPIRALTHPDVVALPDPKRSMTFSGIGIYKPQLFAGLPAGTAAPLAPLLHDLVQNNQALGSYHSGQWTDVGTPQRLYQLQQHLAQSG